MVGSVRFGLRAQVRHALRKRNAGKPLDGLIDGRTVFEVLKVS